MHPRVIYLQGVQRDSQGQSVYGVCDLCWDTTHCSGVTREFEIRDTVFVFRQHVYDHYPRISALCQTRGVTISGQMNVRPPDCHIHTPCF